MNPVPVERWDGGSWFAEIYENPPRREVYRVIERVLHEESGAILEVLSRLPPDWAETPVWKDSLRAEQSHYVAEAQALPQALQQFALEIWQKYTIDNSLEPGENSCQAFQKQTPSELEKTQPQKQQSLQASSLKRRPEIQVGLLFPPKSSLVRHSRTKPNPSISNEKRNKKKKAVNSLQKSNHKAIDVATSS